MRQTGIVRRMDELGRVVIPKELRRTMRLREGEEVEVLQKDDTLVIKKFSAVGEMIDFQLANGTDAIVRILVNSEIEES